MRKINRRALIQSAVLASATSLTGLSSATQVERTGGTYIKLSCNAYSYNTPLREGRIKLMELIDLCAQLNLDAVDLTGYYFQGYPAPPSKKEINEVYYFIGKVAAQHGNFIIHRVQPV